MSGQDREANPEVRAGWETHAEVREAHPKL